MISALATVRPRGLELADPIDFEARLRKKFRVGAPAVLYLEPLRAARSAAQNRWYWGVLIKALCDYTHYSPNEMHAILKAKFLPKALAVWDRNGRLVGEYVIGGTTTTLTPAEFSLYCDECRAWALDELGVAVTDRPLHTTARNSRRVARNEETAGTRSNKPRRMVDQ